MRSELRIEINRDRDLIKVFYGIKEIKTIVCKDKEELVKMNNVLLSKNDLEILDWCRGWCYFLELGTEEDNAIIRAREEKICTN